MLVFSSDRQETAMFENVTTAPPDAIFGLTEAMRADPRPDKVNLGAGVYQDEHGNTPVFAAVKEAERRIWEHETTKAYLPIDGHRDFARHVQALLFGDAHPVLADGRAVTVQAPGGTGALRVLGDFIFDSGPDAVVWLTDPTWPNHPQIFEAAGFDVDRFAYLDRAHHTLAYAAMTAALVEEAEPGDLVVLHGCCHNPSGVDPTPEQWEGIGELLARQRVLPVVDFAYQGFAAGVAEDVAWLPALLRHVPELAVCSSYSKNFGLYNERVGALTVVAADGARALAVLSQLKRAARAAYSNPPAHGAAIVAAILGDAALAADWQRELGGMRERIRRMRALLAAGLDQRGVQLHADGNGFITRQHGMFSFTGLDQDQVRRVRAAAAVYMVDSGRINVAGLNETNVDRVCDAIAAVQ
jgi:aspartate/tyrosine/aromatic aminotransferase